jgi:hypothetical protein
MAFPSLVCKGMGMGTATRAAPVLPFFTDASAAPNEEVARVCEGARLLLEAQFQGAECAFQVHVTGSHRLGVATAHSDLDLVVVGWPSRASSHAPPVDGVVVLRTMEAAMREPGATDWARHSSVACLDTAFPPLLTFVSVGGLEVDIQFVWAPSEVQAQAQDQSKDDRKISFLSDRWLCVPHRALPSVQALRLPLELESLLGARWGRFQATLRAVRRWASVRELTGNSLGLLGGVSWALLVAFSVLTIDVPEDRPWDSLRAFFYVCAHWHWPLPIALRMPQLRPALEWVDLEAERPSQVWTPPAPTARVDGAYLALAARAQKRAAEQKRHLAPFVVSHILSPPLSTSSSSSSSSSPSSSSSSTSTSSSSPSTSSPMSASTSTSTSAPWKLLPCVFAASALPDLPAAVTGPALAWRVEFDRGQRWLGLSHEQARRVRDSIQETSPKRFRPSPPSSPALPAAPSPSPSSSNDVKTKTTTAPAPAPAPAPVPAPAPATAVAASVSFPPNDGCSGLARSAMPILTPSFPNTNTSFNVSAASCQRLQREFRRAYALVAPAEWPSSAAAARAWDEACAPYRDAPALPLVLRLRFESKTPQRTGPWANRCRAIGWRLLALLHDKDPKIRVESGAFDDVWTLYADVPLAKLALESFWHRVLSEWTSAIRDLEQWLDCELVLEHGDKQLARWSA